MHHHAAAQPGAPDSIGAADYKVVIPGPQYEAGGFEAMLWGKHYRKEWTTPVRVPVLRLDSAFGGLEPVSSGGGRQTKTLRLRDKNGKEYVLRSVDKSFTSEIPEIARGTIVETVVNDQVSTSHPFAAVTIPFLAEAAGIYHTNPRIYYVPRENALGEFNNDFGDQLYLLEERPAGDQSDTKSFGYSGNVIGTDSLLSLLLSSNDNRVDQPMLVRCRLFDMFIGDWGRHEDQWRWAAFKQGDNTLYRPIPRDRDQAYTLYDGFLVSLLKSSIQYGLESFDYEMDDVKQFNFPARYLDRRLINETRLDTWLSVAGDLKEKLSDQVIENAVRQLPVEIYASSGKIIEEKLKSRRNEIDRYAREYYLFLAKAIDIPGSTEREWFEVNQDADGNTTVEIFDLKDDSAKGNRRYARTFSNEETEEIRIYGIGGKDHFHISPNPENKMKLRLVGGPSQDVYSSTGRSAKKPLIYDNRDNSFGNRRWFSRKLANDSAVHAYNYQAFSYNKNGIKKAIFYNNRDRIFIRTGYYVQKSKWRKLPYGFRHDLNLNYSIWQNAFSVEYIGHVPQIFGKWDLRLDGVYDGARDFHFPGTGNEVEIDRSIRGYYRVNTREFHGNVGLLNNFGRFQQFGLHIFYQGIKLLHDDDTAKFLSRFQPEDQLFAHRDYAGARTEYNFVKLNDPVLPTRGFVFLSGVSFIHPFDKNSKDFFRFTGTVGGYIPIARHITLVSKVVAATNTEATDFYQLNRLGGAGNFRGYLRFRFYGKSSFLNSNELQVTFPFRSYLANGTAGLIGFFDNGRVWQPGEISESWHTSFGGGFMLAPFNKVVLALTYGLTKEGSRIDLRLGRML